ncbi:MAG TPA: hypothetical protein EYG73_12215 [Arcobacter sp.]|nr:hypothetical protein [Arcobacter sp.]
MNYKDFKENLRLNGLSEEAFGNLTNTPMPTIRGWFAKRKNRTPNTPKWVSPYLELYEQNKQNEAVIKYLEEKSNGKD